MPQEIGWARITAPTTDDISDEDEGKWGAIQNERTYGATFDDPDDHAGLAELAIRRGTLAERPAPVDLDPSDAGRLYLVEDDTPATLTYWRGDDWERVNESDTSVTHYMSDYADPDSGQSVDIAFDNAISEAAPGDVIDFNDGQYVLDSPHVIQKPITVTSTSGEVVCTNTTNNDAHIEFRGGGIQETTTTSGDVVAGQRVIPVTDTSLFAEDTRILLMTAPYAEETDAKIQFGAVESVDSGAGTITLTGGIARPFASGTDIHTVDLLMRPSIENLDTSGGGIRHLQMMWCESPKFVDTHVSEYLEVSLQSLNCWKPLYQSVEATDPEGRGSGEGEPIAIYRCSDAAVYSPRVYDCRRGVDMAWGTHNVTIVDPVIQGFNIAGISVHGGDQCGTFNVQGGTLVADPDGITGNCVVNTEYAPMHISDTKMVVRRAGLHCLGPTRASNIDVRMAPTTNPGNAALIKHSHCHIEGLTIEDPDNRGTQYVEVNSEDGAIEQCSVEFDIEAGGQDHVYLHTENGNAIDDLRLDGSIRSGGNNQAMWFYANDGIIENIHTSVDVHEFTDQCVRIDANLGEFGHLSFTDCHMESSAKAVIYDRNPLGANSKIHVANNTFESGGTTLSFNDEVGYLWVVNNHCPGTIDTTGGVNVHTSGNL